MKDRIGTKIGNTKSTGTTAECRRRESNKPFRGAVASGHTKRLGARIPIRKILGGDAGPDTQRTCIKPLSKLLTMSRDLAASTAPGSGPEAILGLSIIGVALAEELKTSLTGSGS
jgi:hypothetical protein